jgi:hypothetical protein
VVTVNARYALGRLHNPEHDTTIQNANRMTGWRRRPVGCAGGEQTVHPFAIVSRHLRPCELRKSRSFSSIAAFSGEFERLTASSSQNDRGRRVEPLTGSAGLPS